MATADKLNKLLETKQAIKQAIIDKGVAVADTDTFASYATKIREITTGSNSIPIPWMSGYNELYTLDGTVRPNSGTEICSELMSLKAGTYSLSCTATSWWLGLSIYNYDTEAFENWGDSSKPAGYNADPLTFTLTSNKKVRFGTNIEGGATRNDYILTTFDGGLA